MKLIPSIEFEDEHIIVVNKPAGLLTLPDRYDSNKPNLVSFLKKKYPEIYVVHRLDKETSGIMIFAKNAESHKHLSNQFQERKVEKIYHAFVFGTPLENTGLIKNYLVEDPFQPGVMRVAPKGKLSITAWQTLETFKTYSILEATIHTGRMHQIRVHMKNLGHPLMVDAIYGHEEAFYLSSLKGRAFRLGKYEEEAPLVSRTTLHAKKLALFHPADETWRTFEVPYPKDLNALYKQLKKWAS